MTGLKLSWMQTVFSAISKVVTEWPACLYLSLCRSHVAQRCASKTYKCWSYVISFWENDILWATFPVKCCTSLCNVFCKGDKSRGTKKVNSQRPEVNKWRKPGEHPNAHINYTIMWKPACAASVYFISWHRVLNVIFCHCFFLIKTEKLQSGTEGKSVYVSIRYISEMRMQSVQKGQGQKKRKLKK